MTAMVSNQQQALQAVNSAQLVGIFKAIAPRSFEKTFDGMPTAAINHAMKICIEGLDRDQINLGLSQVRDNGFCPDLAMFRKWCLGITGFGTEQQRVQDSFKGKNAALANITKWLENKGTVITNAEREAYNRCYEMFTQIQWSSNPERTQQQAQMSFKDCYQEVVREFAEKGISQSDWEEPKAIEKREQLGCSYRKDYSAEKVAGKEFYIATELKTNESRKFEILLSDVESMASKAMISLSEAKQKCISLAIREVFLDLPDL